jgi:uncharacterized protein YbdZ (MbtH family)
MSTNPFDDDTRQYLVLVNDEGQHSLWPHGVDVPAGWHCGFGPAARRECLQYVETKCADMRPLSLVAATTSGVSRNGSSHSS